MRITIDTKEDTHEDIRKVLHILTHILEKKDYGLSSSYAQRSNPITTTTNDSAGFMNMFGEGSSQTDNQEPNQTNSDLAPDFSNFMNLVNKKEEDKKEKPKLEFF